MELRCEHGNMGELLYTGFISEDEAGGKNMKNYGNDYCGAANQTNSTGSSLLPKNCTQFIDVDGVKREYNKECKGSERCQLHVFNHTKEVTKEIKESALYKSCNKRFSYIYVQSECKLPKWTLKRNQIVGIVIACMATLILLSYSSATFYWNKIIDLEFRLWDVNTCTVADFTVDMKISRALRESFENYK